MSVIMYKVIDNEIAEECVRPAGYQEHLKNGWVVDLAELESPKEEEPIIEMPVVKTVKKKFKKPSKLKMSNKLKG